jgi:hypothetical protein
MSDHLVPFQDSVRLNGWTVPFCSYPPTATQWLASTQETLRRELPHSGELVPAFGLGTTDQSEPFQASTRVLSYSEEVSYSPTATQLLELVQETPPSQLWLLRAGAGTIDHALPFQRSINARGVSRPSES